MDALYTYRDARYSQNGIIALYKYYKKNDKWWYYDEYKYSLKNNIWHIKDPSNAMGLKKDWNKQQIKDHVNERFKTEQFVSEQQWNNQKAELDLKVEMAKHMVK